MGGRVARINLAVVNALALLLGEQDGVNERVLQLLQ